MKTPRFADPLLIAVLVPPALLLLVSLAALAAAPFGYHPLWPEERPSVSEAVMLRDLGALVESLQSTPDMAARYPVRPVVADGAALSLTPFEAAIAGRRDDVVRFLEQRHITPGPAERLRLQCLAAREGARDLITIFGPPPADSACEEGPTVR
jgi:hypothetical protein